MELSEYDLKKLGFRPKAKNKNEMEVHVEVAKNAYISISIFNQGDNWIFSGLEIEGAAADQIRKDFFTDYSTENILDFLNKY